MIKSIQTNDTRFDIGDQAGSDAIHKNPQYSYAVTLLKDNSGHTGSGLAFTLGEGNDLVCRGAEFLASSLQGRDIEDLMANFGEVQRKLADEQQFRWLGPHKGVAHLALSSVTNACWDLWAKTRGVPLWKLLLDLSPEELVNTIDFSYLEDELTKEQALKIITDHQATRKQREGILHQGYPGYDTSIGWFNYSDEQIKENVKKSVDAGFTAMKLKVGSSNMDADLKRTEIVRSGAGRLATLMVDANQQWTLSRALEFGERAKDYNLFWIEEPTHPDDILGHATLAKAYAPHTKVAAGEHVPNRIIFKNYFQAKAFGYCQADAVRVAGISEFLAISLMARQRNIPVVPHVGDMGQIHQHLVLFNHIGLGHEALLLEHIPHLSEHFIHPCQVSGGVYHTPQEPGMSSDLK
ncbi:mandelate racemase [Verrucomicrobiaceae bacterium N1E253]|uniref:Mandelate racemase n=1 Tax=Oceaniferula marina TaxID=2748318 RepID=A0A851GFJ1_9BACT|nr:enolase C-terminal domain-like protein [Oceaniferula marina]NWK56176.1 mandelate racemase [Oceaniferula marina]